MEEEGEEEAVGVGGLVSTPPAAPIALFTSSTCLLNNLEGGLFKGLLSSVKAEAPVLVASCSFDPSVSKNNEE